MLSANIRLEKKQSMRSLLALGVVAWMGMVVVCGRGGEGFKVLEGLPEKVDFGGGFVYENDGSQGVYVNPGEYAAHAKSTQPDAAPFCFSRVAEIREVVKTAKALGQAAEWSSEVLSLEGCYLAVLPPEVGSLSNVRELRLGKNQLSSLPLELANMEVLETLVLIENKIETLPAVIPMLPALKTLVLARNQMEKLHPSVGDLVHLEILYLEGNKLSSLPKTLSALKNLEVLHLGNNEFSTLPRIVCTLDSLMELNLEGNGLRTVPKCLGERLGGRLLWLPLNNNKLRDIPRAFESMKALRALNFEGNNLEEVPVFLKELTPGKGGALVDLSLKGNAIKSIPPWFVEFAPAMTELDLSENALESVPDFLGTLSSLVYLDLAYNSVTEVGREVGQVVENAGFEDFILEGNPLGGGLPDEWCVEGSRMWEYVSDVCV